MTGLINVCTSKDRRQHRAAHFRQLLARSLPRGPLLGLTILSLRRNQGPRVGIRGEGGSAVHHRGMLNKERGGDRRREAGEREAPHWVAPCTLIRARSISCSPCPDLEHLSDLVHPEDNDSAHDEEGGAEDEVEPGLSHCCYCCLLLLLSSSSSSNEGGGTRGGSGGTEKGSKCEAGAEVAGYSCAAAVPAAVLGAFRLALVPSANVNRGWTLSLSLNENIFALYFLL